MITPDTIGSEPPHRNRPKWLLTLFTIAGAFIAFGIGISIGAAGHTTAKPAPAKTIFVTEYPSSEPSPAQPPSTPPDTSNDLTGPLGTTFTDTTTDQSGNDVSYDVTATKIADLARGSDQFTTPDQGNRFVGVKFRITGDTGYSSDDANNDAVLIGNDGQTYTADFSSISEGTNFNNGEFGVRAGQTQTGWVTFQVPKGVKVSSIQWAPGSGQPAEWDL